MVDGVRQQIFTEGDQVCVVGPLAGKFQDEIGTICTVTNRGNIYRYSVKFGTGIIVEMFFEFELQRVPPVTPD